MKGVPKETRYNKSVISLYPVCLSPVPLNYNIDLTVLIRSSETVVPIHVIITLFNESPNFE